MDLTSEQEKSYFNDALGEAFGYGAASDFQKPTLSLGSRNVVAVKELQNLLILVNGPSAVGSSGADGDFGAGTEAGVMHFQSQNGLARTGKADSETWDMLYENTGQAPTGQSKGEKTLSTIDAILKGITGSISTFAPMIGPKQDYAPSTITGSNYSPPVDSSGMSTGMKVGLGVVGVVVVGGGLYLIINRGK